MDTKNIGPRGKPTSSLHLGVLDLEHILKEAIKIQSSQYSPSLFTPDQLESASSFAYSELQSEEKKQNLSWLVPSTLVETFQVLTYPLSSTK